MNAEIISVGTELLLGQIANTDAQYISQCLSEIGIGVYYHVAVGDNWQRIIDTIDFAAKRSDIVICTGGLGPTADDMTKEALCEYLGLTTVLHQKSYERLKERFARMAREITENNLKQVYFPENSTVLDNDKGTAPGMYYEREDGKIFICLPGPPFELKAMFSNYVMPIFRAKSGYVIKSKVVRMVGIGESAMELVVKDILDNQTNPTVAPLIGNGDVTLRITARAENDDEADKLIAPVKAEIERRLSDYIYGYDDDTPEKVLVTLLKQKNMKISTAESCTGGLVASRITDVSGASDVIEKSFVTYSNNAKNEILGVKKETLSKFGAISSNTAEEMAKGLLEITNSDIAISVTGNAGPTASEDKDVGLVFIGTFGKNGKGSVREYHFAGTRERIKLNASLNALIQALKLIR